MTNIRRCRHILYILGAVSAGFPLKKKFGTNNRAKIVFARICESNLQVGSPFGAFLHLNSSFMKFFKSKNNTTLGELGESIATKYLKKSGYKILETNFKNDFGKRLGEIDIIAQNDNELVFVEVKTRIASNKALIIPEENISRNKLHKLGKIIAYYIKRNNLWDKTYRIDAISLLIDKNNRKYSLKHLKNIFY